jgi:hypothetical protein
MLWQAVHSVLLAEGATGLMAEGSIIDLPRANCSPTILPCNMDGPRNVPSNPAEPLIPPKPVTSPTAYKPGIGFDEASKTLH